MEAFDFSGGGGVAGSGVFLFDVEFDEKCFEAVPAPSASSEASCVDGNPEGCLPLSVSTEAGCPCLWAVLDRPRFCGDSKVWFSKQPGQLLGDHHGRSTPGCKPELTGQS